MAAVRGWRRLWTRGRDSDSDPDFGLEYRIGCGSRATGEGGAGARRRGGIAAGRRIDVAAGRRISVAAGRRVGVAAA